MPERSTTEDGAQDGLIREADLARILTAFAETLLHVRIGNTALLARTLETVGATLYEVAGSDARDPAARVLRAVAVSLEEGAVAAAASEPERRRAGP